MTKSEMRMRIDAAMLSYNGVIERNEKVLGRELLSKVTANFRSGSGKNRMGKCGSGKHQMAERRANWTAFR
jgi:hypothetical protein